MILPLNQLFDFLEQNKEKFLVIGQPRGVGLTTEMCVWTAKKMFFEEHYNIMILVDSLRSKSFFVDIFTEALTDYEYKFTFDYKNNVGKVYNNQIAIISYPNEDVAVMEVSQTFKFDLAYIDKDSDYQILETYLTDYLPERSEQIIVATYDFETSLFYIPGLSDEQKLVVYSDFSKKNIWDLSNRLDYTLEEERIIKGFFNENRI